MKFLGTFVMLGVAVSAMSLPQGMEPLPLDNYTAIVPPSESLPRCLPTGSPAALQGVRVGVMVDEGASFYDTTMSYQFFMSRNATVEFFCPFFESSDGGQTRHSLTLLDDYLPKGSVKTCTSGAETTLLSKLLRYQILVVPSGFASVESLRPVGTYLAEYLNATQTGSRKLVLIGGSADLLVAPTSPLLNLSVEASLPSGASPDLHDFVSSPRFPTLGSIKLVNPPSQLNVSVISFKTSEHDAKMIVGKNSSFLRSVLLHAASEQTTALCSDTLVEHPSQFEYLDQSTYGAFTTKKNATSNLGVPVSGMVLGEEEMSSVCFNKNHLNFCNGWEFGLIVSHGSHDVEVMAALTSLGQNGAKVNVYCPLSIKTESDVDAGFVYLMPEPPTYPSYTVRCDYFLSQWAFIGKGLSGTIVVPHGVIATHGALRNNLDLRNALTLTETFSLYGSSMILLSLNDVEDQLIVVPSCPVTNLDLATIEGFEIAPNSSALTFRHASLKHTKVLAGFDTKQATTSNFNAFLTLSVQGLVWESQQNHMRDAFVGAVFLTMSAVLIVAVVVVVCLRTKRLARRDGYRTTSTDDQTPGDLPRADSSSGQDLKTSPAWN